MILDEIGGRFFCHPCPFTLNDPPIEKELNACMIDIDLLCLSKYRIASSQRAPEPIVSTLFEASSSICLYGSMLITIPFGYIVWPPILCRAPAIEIFRLLVFAWVSIFFSCSIISLLSFGTWITVSTFVRFRKLASFVYPTGILLSISVSFHFVFKRWINGIEIKIRTEMIPIIQKCFFFIYVDSIPTNCIPALAMSSGV